MKIRIQPKFLLLSVLLGLSVKSWAQIACQQNFLNVEGAQAKLETWLAVDDKASAKQTLDQYLEFTKNPALLALLPHNVYLDILTDPEMPNFGKVLGETFGAMNVGTPLSDELRQSAELPGQFERALQGILETKVPRDSVAERLRGLHQANLANARRALGALTPSEMTYLLVGNDPQHPSADSLVGKYAAETGAVLSTRGFTLDAGNYLSPNVGPQRTIVPVSAASFDTFKKYFFREELFAVYGHAYVYQNGLLKGYHHQNIEFRVPGVNTPLPMVVLSSTEAQRFTQFWKFNVQELKANRGYSNGSRATMPWLVGPGYCAQGGYSQNCTHYIANIPVGDRLVDEYAFPASFEGGGDKAPKIQKLQPYQSDDLLMKRVWKSPGNEQLADVLGVREQNLLGEMASPGYLIFTILSKLSVERAPIVFMVVADHKQALPANFPYSVENAH